MSARRVAKIESSCLGLYNGWQENMIEFDDNELKNRVDEVLFYIWDPIGVSHEPCARWEYKSYIPQVLRLIEQNDDPERD